MKIIKMVAIDPDRNFLSLRPEVHFWCKLVVHFW